MSDDLDDPTRTKATAAYQEAQERIAQAASEGATDLDLSRLGLTSVPPEIGQLTRLHILFLHDNQLTSVPLEIRHLTKLQQLFLFNNGLTSVPPEIGQLTQLKFLYLPNNQLTSVPPEIGQFTQLQQLYLSDNQLTSVPPEIGQLTQLLELKLSNNQLMSVPSEIGRLTKLERLLLRGNRLESLPESLRRLWNLIQLDLQDNPQLKLPDSVLGTKDWKTINVAHPPRAILNYYFRTRPESERMQLCEGKLILVGRGDVGKTSLVRRLVDNKFSRREDTTQGIRIRQWPIKVAKKKDAIRLHVWDFGGQEIMHATHQLFLTDRSLYLLVLDGRGGQQETEADYWLRLIASFAPESPVLVILNKIKRDHFDLNRGATMQKFPQVQGFIETDCDNPGRDKKPGKNGHGIKELNAAIADHVDKLPEIRQAFPAAWFAIKERLSEAEKNFLTIDEYRELCVELGEPDENSQANLSVFLHRLGIALNFCDDPRIDDKHVLNPHWLTTGIYTLLNSKTLAARKGELRPADIATELDVKKYPAEMHPFLINLMERFELCFSFEDKGKKTTGKASRAERFASRYLIPELLDPQQPDAAKEFDPAKCLNFHYAYPVLPPGLLPRFIVRTHVLSEEYRWKSGVILNFEGNMALVKADAQEKTIRILIDGPSQSRRRMLAMIRQDFDVIHRDVPHLKPKELVSFPNHAEITERYEELEVLFDDDPNTPIKRVFEGKVVTATVRELLEGVELSVVVHSSVRALDRMLADPSLKVFYSYAHADAKQRLKLEKHLAPLERTRLIRGWYDNEIGPGSEFDQEIADKMGAADIVLLLISPDFVASKYCYEVELNMAMERHAEGKVCVLPIIIRPTNSWEKVPAGDLQLGSLNALPESGKPIPDWKPHDSGWANVAAGVERAADVLRNKKGPLK